MWGYDPYTIPTGREGLCRAEDIKLFDTVKNEQPAGTIIVNIPRDTRRNVPKRTATLEIKDCRVNVIEPVNTPQEFRKNASVA